MPLVRRALWLIALLAVLAGAWLAPLDLPAEKKVDEGLKRALISFASARALNAVISVAQGTEASVQPFGVGVTLAPGRILEPVHDLVEQFSTLMLAASVVFGVQKGLIAMGGYWPVSLALSLAAAGWVACRWRGGRAPSALSRLLLMLLMLRFAIPVVTLGTDLLWQRFLAPDYAASQAVMGSAPGNAARLDPSAAASGASGIPGAPGAPGRNADAALLDKLKAWAAKGSDLTLNYGQLQQAVEHAIEHAIRLIVIFLLQTLVVPLLLAWLLYGVMRRLLEGGVGGTGGTGRWPSGSGQTAPVPPPAPAAGQRR